MDEEKKVTQINKKKCQAELEAEIRDNLDEVVNEIRDDVCKECRAKEEEEEDFPESWIRSPVQEDSDFPMVIVISGNFRYIGAFGYNSDADPSRIILFTPLLLAELAEDVPGKGRNVAPVMSKLYYTLELFEMISLRCDNLIFLNSAHKTNLRLVTMYGECIEKFSAEDVGLVAPTLDDIHKLSHLTPHNA